MSENIVKYGKKDVDKLNSKCYNLCYDYITRCLKVGNDIKVIQILWKKWKEDAGGDTKFHSHFAVNKRRQFDYFLFYVCP